MTPTPTPSKALPEAELWVLKAAAAAMNCSLPLVYQRIARGDIKAFMVGHKMMVEPESVKSFMRERPVFAHAKPKADLPVLATEEMPATIPQHVTVKGKKPAKSKPGKRPAKPAANKPAAAAGGTP